MAAWALVSTIIVGLLIGGLGRLVVPGRQAIGWARTLLAGLAGSIVGGFVGQHVLDLGRLVTILVEIAIAAVVVLAFARSNRGLARRSHA